jgi:hypothetical protein
MQTGKIASALAAATALTLLALLGVVLKNGISQQYFELVHPPEIYTQKIVTHSSALNIIFILDNIFIILYTAMAFFVVKTYSNNAPAFVSLVTFILISLVALLDFLENFNIYTLMQQSKSGNTVSAASISWQSVESMLKWHSAYLAFFMLGFLIPKTSLPEKILKYALWFMFVPAGLLVYATADTQYAQLFQWIRNLNLLGGFVLFFIIMKNKK